MIGETGSWDLPSSSRNVQTANGTPSSRPVLAGLVQNSRYILGIRFIIEHTVKNLLREAAGHCTRRKGMAARDRIFLNVV
jgi:hypothetical protein